MKINLLGYHYHHDTNFTINRPTGSGDYLLLLVHTPAYFKLGDSLIHTKANTLILYEKSAPQIYGADNQDFMNDFIHFDIENETELSYLNSILSFQRIYEIPTMELLSKQIRDLSIEHLSTNNKKNESLQLLLKLLFIKIEEQLQSSANDKPYSTYYHNLLSIRSYLYNEAGKKHTVEELASFLNLSPSYFQALYKKTFGISCIQDVIQSRIDYAKYNLTQTNYPIKDIAALCGYDNDVHFMRQFKKITGYTPKQYRMNQRLNP